MAFKTTLTRLINERNELKEKVEQLEKALKFYADKENYEEWNEDLGLTEYIHNVDFDGGDTARTELIRQLGEKACDRNDEALKKMNYSLCGVCNEEVSLGSRQLGMREGDGSITPYHMRCERELRKLEPCEDCGQHRKFCNECKE